MLVHLAGVTVLRIVPQPSIFTLLLCSTGEDSDFMVEIPDSARQYFSDLGRKGAKGSNASRTKKQRSEQARKAAKARWAKKRRGKK
jgi:hypothetical protein